MKTNAPKVMELHIELTNKDIDQEMQQEYGIRYRDQE
jgi:hypothetical protein